jgi:hypothetical protein
MGKRGRQFRAQVKRLARSGGFVETELGEVKRRISKTEARIEFLRQIDCVVDLAMQEFERGNVEGFYRLVGRSSRYGSLIIKRFARRAAEEISALEDARFLAEINASLNVAT